MSDRRDHANISYVIVGRSPTTHQSGGGDIGIEQVPVRQTEIAMNVRRIFHPTDFSPCADVALRFALQLALRFDADLYIGHVTGGGRAYWDAEMSVEPEDSNLNTRLRESAVRILSDLSTKDAKKLRIEYQIIHHETPAAGIVRFAAQLDVDLLVMGTHGRRAIGRFLLGSVALKVLHTATTDVVMVPGSYSREQSGGILVPVDLYDRSVEQVAAAVMLAQQFGAEVEVLHVLDLPERSQFVPDATISVDVDSLSEVVEKRLDALTQPLDINAPLTSHVKSGRPAATILEYIQSSNPNLVVMACSGMSPAERIRRRYQDSEQEARLLWLIGPVTERIVTHARVPVLVLKRFSDEIPRIAKLALSESTAKN